MMDNAIWILVPSTMMMQSTLFYLSNVKISVSQQAKLQKLGLPFRLYKAGKVKYSAHTIIITGKSR